MARETFEQRTPESLGPGYETGDGGVAYGVDIRPRVVVPPRRDPAEVARERALSFENPRCGRCMALPDEMVEVLTHALQAAAKKGGAP